MRRSVYNSTTTAVSLLPVARTATANGTAVDRRGSNLENYRSAMLVVLSGLVTDGTHAIKLQESADNSSWSDVAAADLQGSAISLTTSTDDQRHELGYTGSARYLRAVTTVSGSPVTGGIYGAVLVLSGARRTPLTR